MRKIRWDVLMKARKRQEAVMKWPEDWRLMPYVIALDFGGWPYDVEYLHTVLIGHAVHYVAPLPMPEIPEMEGIKRAREEGWESYMLEKHILPSGRVCPDPEKRGAFFTEKVMEKVSGVLVRSKGALDFFPNPFALDGIRMRYLTRYLSREVSRALCC